MQNAGSDLEQSRKLRYWRCAAEDMRSAPE